MKNRREHARAKHIIMTREQQMLRHKRRHASSIFFFSFLSPI